MTKILVIIAAVIMFIGMIVLLGSAISHTFSYKEDGTETRQEDNGD